ncbi:hypothetical protein BDF22DRAFT_676113 [Syncephalis plumigaleata]|nr:hypothetical protein BDF22DRAFT_676113 [Syncephalis plumigaleata]
MMIRKTMHYNLMFASYIISVVYCICFLIHLANYFTFNKFVNDIYNLLSKLPFDLILIHWSIVGRNLFSKKMLILFRVFIGLDITVHTIAFGLRLKFYSLFLAIVELGKSFSLLDLQYVTGFVLIFNALVFLSFAIWFAFNAYRLKRHVEGYHRFMQLMWFCAICFVTYAIFSVCVIIYFQSNLILLSSSQYATYDAIYDTTYLIRAIILLVCLGVAWPRVKCEDEKLPHSPLGGMTTVDHVIKTHVYTTHHPAADGFVNRIKHNRLSRQLFNIAD